MTFTVPIPAATALVLLTAAGLSAQTPVPPPQNPAGSALAAQQASASAMQASIAQQETSAQQQLSSTSSGSFFLLPPPAHMEGVDLPAAEVDCPPLPDDTVRSLAGQAAKREGLDTDLVLNVMRQESGFRPCAVSPKGAMGLMQLMPSTADDLGLTDYFDPLENVNAGVKFLKQLLSRYDGNLEKAISAYNAGTGRVDAVNGIPPIPETINYVNHVLNPPAEKH